MYTVAFFSLSHCSSDIRLETLAEDYQQLKEDNRQLKEDVHNLQQTVETLSARMEELMQNVSRHMNNFNYREESGHFSVGSAETSLVVSQGECCFAPLCRKFRCRKK